MHSQRYQAFPKKLLAFKAIPIIARGNPYVSIRADHSDPGRILKYAQNPYLGTKKPLGYGHQNAGLVIYVCTVHELTREDCHPLLNQ